MISRRIFKRFDARIRTAAPWGPTIVGLALAATVADAALRRAALVPIVNVPDTALGTAAVIIQLVAVPLLVFGLFSRFAAAGLAVVGVMTFVWTPFPMSLQAAPALGAALFVLGWGRGRLSLGSYFKRFIAMDPGHLRYIATLLLRTSLAIFFLVQAWFFFRMHVFSLKLVVAVLVGVLLPAKLIARTVLIAALVYLMLMPFSFVLLPAIAATIALLILGKMDDVE